MHLSQGYGCDGERAPGQPFLPFSISMYIWRDFWMESREMKETKVSMSASRCARRRSTVGFRMVDLEIWRA